MTKAIMIQGAGSNVGKSLFVAGLCRHFAKQGLRIRPFKPQNMSNNAAVAADGGEIGRAQALQARAAGVEPSIHMNPILLKPETDTGAQVIVQGQRFATMAAREYGKQKAALMPRILDSFWHLGDEADLIIVEGAGSPAEVNLRAGDVANMGFAEAAGLPVVLVGDIDRGGVIAQLVGTHAVLPPDDRARIKAFAVNKFRGDVSLFVDGERAIADATGWANVGTLPWFADAWRLPAEDIMDLRRGGGRGALKIAVPRLNRIANFDDLDPLTSEPGATVDIIEPGRALPGDAALVLIPGSKNTINDLAAFRANGWDIDLTAHIRRGGHVLGICGGYQMLGRRIHDPDGIEGSSGSVDGLGHLDVETVMRPEKRLELTGAVEVATGHPVAGYEIHIGETSGPDCARGWLKVAGEAHGAANATGQVMGCYLHGLFAADDFRSGFLQRMGGQSAGLTYEADVDATLDSLADHMAAHLDTDRILEIAETINK